MEVIKGTAVSVRYTVHVTGNKDGVSTRHHAIFKVGGMTVLFSSSAPAVINEGDKLVIAGRMKGRVLLAEAYRNHTASVRGDSGLWLNFVGMLFAFFFGAVGLGWLLLEPVLLWLPRLDETMSWFVAAFSALFIIWGCYCLYKWLRIREAVRLVMGG
jgi:hypothetical protein